MIDLHEQHPSLVQEEPGFEWAGRSRTIQTTHGFSVAGADFFADNSIGAVGLKPSRASAELWEKQMANLTFEGRVENGQIRLPENVTLPEHTKVYVVVADFESAPQARVYSPRLVHPEQVTDFAKQIVEAPADAEL